MSIHNNSWQLKKFFQNDIPGRRLNFAIALLILFLTPILLNGQTAPDSAIIKIIWKARGDIGERELRQWGDQQKIHSAELETKLQQVLRQAQQRGFYFAQIDSVKRHATDATIYFKSMPKTRLLASVNFMTSTPAISLVNWQQERRGTYDEAGLAQRFTNILADFSRRGYPLANFNFDSATISPQREDLLATLHWQFDPGPAVQIDSLVLRGNKITKRKVLLRELPMQPGEAFNLEQVQSIPERLLRLGYLQSIAPPQLAVDARGRYLLDINIVEGNSNVLNGVVGYNPGEGQQKGFVTGLLEVKFGNLLGTGRQLNARWEKRSRQSQELALRYREPWVAGYPVHLAGGFQQLIQDTSYVERRWDFAAELPLGQNFIASGHLAQESIAPDSLARVRFNLPHSSVTSLGASLRYDSTDDPINPRRGIIYLTTVETGRKSAAPAGVARQNFSREKIFIDLHGLFPISGPQVLSLAVHGRQVKSNAPPEILVTDQFRFGGATTLRGYREEQFRGSRVAWGNLEYRYLLSRRTRAFVFFDAGYYSGFEYANTPTLELNQTEDSIYAWGLGARVDTPLGIIGVDYGLGKGDPLTNGKVHISLLNSF